VSMSARVLAGVAVTSHADPVLNTARFSKLSFLGSGWTSRDIGTPEVTGAASFSADGEWMVAGSGANIAGTSDEFHFVSQDFSGDGPLTAQVTSVEQTDPYAKAGLMFRESTAADSEYAFAFIGPSTVGFECRTATGATTTGVSYAGGTAPRWVRLVRSGTSFSASYSSDGTTWTPLGTAQSISMNVSSKAGLAVTAHNVSDVCESTFESVSLLPAVWSARDIGGPGLPGGTVFQAATGAWTLTGSGTDIWNTADQMQFAYQTLAGDSVVVARVTALQNTDPYAKAGVMMRSSTAVGSRNAAVVATPSAVYFQTRPASDGTTSLIGSAAVTTPVWVRVVRSGTSYTGWYSADGLAWTRLGTPQTITMSATPLAGLAVTSHDATALNNATLDNVSLTTLPAGFSSWTAFQNANFTTTQLANPNVSGPLADPNADGQKNLLAYAFGLSPWTVVTAANGGTPTAQNQNGYLTLTYPRLRNPIDVNYAVEVSSDLTTWNSGPAFTTQLTVTPLDATREQVTVRDNTTITGVTRRAMRLKVTAP
jgi:hypothetical protein